MSIPPDYLIERKLNKSQIRNWKIAAITMFILVLAVSTKKLFPADTLQLNDYIASISIENEILEDAKRDNKLVQIMDDNQIKALIVNVNSPGGTFVGAEKIYNIFRKTSKKKPVVVVMGTMATSGGYLISLGADYIISHNGTITGSIGVIYPTAEVTELAEKIGIKFRNFKSGELKAAPNPMEKVTEAVAEATIASIKDVYDSFVEFVAIRRGLSIEDTRQLADGRIYTGRQALRLKLIDAIGSEDDAVKWLQEVKKIDSKLKVKEVKLKSENKLLEMIYEDLDTIVPGFFKTKFRGLMSII